MRVLHVYRTYFPDTFGGIEEVINQICGNTHVHGVESRIFCLSPTPTPTVFNHRNTEVHRSRRNFEIASCGISLNALKKFEELVEWADIVHYHFPWPFGDLLHLLSEKKKTSLVTYHSDIIRQRNLLRIYIPLMHKFFDQMDSIVATSPNYYATSTTLTRYSDKVRVIPIGIDAESYPKVEQTLSDQIKRKYPDEYFLFIGSLRYYKGLHILLEAIKDTDLHIVIAGAGTTEAELQQQAQQLNLKNVHFAGEIENKEKVALLKHARGIVFPSHLRSEAFGVTLLEGAMFEKPLISCEIGTGTSYVNQHEETGLVIPPSDAKSLRQAMQQLSQNSKLATQLGKNARRRYEKLFTGKIMGESYFKLYEDLAC